MSENPSDDLVHSLREAGAHYVVDTRGQPVAVLLTLDEYEHYLDLLDDEADSQDEELASRLEQVTARPSSSECQSFRDYLDRRAASRGQEVQS
jgi:PHD/YefM family antitoxin component YafN of YafNO toxin-antitoxin module